MITFKTFRMAFAMVAFLMATVVASAAHAATLTVLHAFRGFPARDGANPHSAPIMNNKGDLYGTASAGGGSGCGMVYRLHKKRNGTWKETTLYSFTCSDEGNGPIGGLVFDRAGNLFGGTELGGTGECFFSSKRIGCGVVYELKPNAHGSWIEAVLYSFPKPQLGTKFGGPLASLTFGKGGALFGTTVLDDTCNGNNFGSVFRLKLTNGIWKERDIHDFCSSDGSSPGYGALLRDAAGNLYGTTMTGGTGTDQGVAFELTPLGHDKWQFTKLHEFTETDGGTLEGGLMLDSSDNLYGAEFAGGTGNHGIIYELSSASGGTWNESTIATFTGATADGQGPWQSPVFDSNGDLFGTTQAGGEAAFCENCGVIYELVPQGGGQWAVEQIGRLHFWQRGKHRRRLRSHSRIGSRCRWQFLRRDLRGRR
jgi:uncharacterized repeat protein (TIGR03803 family)